MQFPPASLVFHLFVAAAVAASSSSSSEDVDGNDSNGIGINVGTAPLAIPRGEWDRALANPNATGHFPINGYDTSKPYLGDGTSPRFIDGWALDFNVTADISAANGVDDFSSRSLLSRDGYVTGAALRLRPPASLVTRSPNGSAAVGFDNNTWSLCATLLGGVSKPLPQATIDAGKNDNGSCVAMLGERCLDDIRRGFTTCDATNSREVPDSCQTALNHSGYGGFCEYLPPTYLYLPGAYLLMYLSGPPYSARHT
jgi:hypothetical protein